MKVALLSRWMWEENRRAGGPESEGGTAQQLAEALQERGHEVIVLTQCDPRAGEGGGEREAAGGAPSSTSILRRSRLGKLEVWETPRWRRSWMAAPLDKALKLLWGHRKALTDATDLFAFLKERGSFDVLWAQCEEPDGVVAGLADTIGVLPPIYCHTYALRYTFAGSVPRFTDVWPIRFAYSRARLAAANSPLVARHMEKDYGTPASKIRVLPHNLTKAFLAGTSAAPDGTPASGYDSAPAESGPQPEPGRVLFLGALNRKKGALEFAEAARLLGYGTGIAPGTPFTFAVIGGVTEDDPLFAREWNQAVAACAGIATVEQLGKISAAEVVFQIRRASVVVLPSLFDEWNRALVEALALGRPVVTTTGVGASYLPERDGSGLVVDLTRSGPGPDGEDDDESRPSTSVLAAAIARVATEPAFLSAAKSKAAAIRNEFSPQSIAARLEEQLLEAVHLSMGRGRRAS